MMPAGQIHHLKQGTGERGIGVRSTDKWGVPLCMDHHEAVERAGAKREGEWFRERGIANPLDLAAALWNVSGSIPRMVEVILSHRE